MNKLHKNAPKVLLWILPALLAMTIIQFIPGIFAVIMGFTKMNVNYIQNLFSVPWAGFENFRTIFTPGNPIGSNFLAALVVTLKFTVLSTIIIYLLGLFGSLILNVKFPGRTLVRALFLIPWIVPSVVSNQIWRMMFLKDFGIINKLLMNVGLIKENIYWLFGDNALWSMIIARAWSSFPFIAISLLAALQTIPSEIYESAKIDGADKVQRFRYITFPGIATISKVSILLLAIWGSSEFNTPFILFSMTPPPAATTLSILIYKNAFQLWDFGMGSAMGTILLCVMMVIAIAYMRLTITKKD